MRRMQAEQEGFTVVEVRDQFDGILLIEVARNCGYPARFVPGSQRKVEVRANRAEVEGMADKLLPASSLIFLRRLEAIAEAVQAIGGEPTDNLLRVLDSARRRVEEFSTSDEGRVEQEDPSSN